MATTRDHSAPDGTDREIVNTRVFDDSHERLFRAWTEPVELTRGWGPQGFTTTFHEFDLRPGGAWRFTMHGPNGVDYPNHSVFREIVAPECIVFDHVSGPKFRLIAILAEEEDKTRLVFRMLFETAAECAKVKGFASAANEQNFDRLEAHLAGTA